MALMFLTRKRNNKSVKDLSHVSCTTVAPGNLVPISHVPIVAGDSVSFNPKLFLQAMPMKAPLVNGFTVCYDYFFVPDRIYNLDLHLNFPDVTDHPEDVKFPVVVESSSSHWQHGDVVDKLPESWWAESNDTSNFIDLASTIVQPGSLADYLGFPVGYCPTRGRGYIPSPDDDAVYSAVSALGYMDIFLNYYANQQEDTFPTAYFRDYRLIERDTADGGVEAEYVFFNGPSHTLPLAELSDFMRFVKTSSDPANSIIDWNNKMQYDFNDAQEALHAFGTWRFLCSRASIFQRCQRPYFLEAWLKTSGYDDALQRIEVDDKDGNLFISMRNISKLSHIQRWMDLSMGGGSRFSDYLNAQFDVPILRDSTAPVFLGSDRKFMGSNVVYQTTGAGNSSSPLGAFAGQSSGGDRFKRRTFHFNEPGTFFVIASLVPDTIYYRGLDPFLRDRTLADKYVPALDNIGMEPLLVETLDRLPYLSTARWASGNNAGEALGLGLTRVNPLSAVGYIPAWSRYDQVTSRAHGRMATELKYWLLVRDYATSPEGESEGLRMIRARIDELNSTTQSMPDSTLEALSAFLGNLRDTGNYSFYILGNMYNDVFADTSNNAQNFVLTFSCDMKVRRERGKVNLPTTL